MFQFGIFLHSVLTFTLLLQRSNWGQEVINQWLENKISIFDLPPQNVSAPSIIIFLVHKDWQFKKTKTNRLIVMTITFGEKELFSIATKIELKFFTMIYIGYRILEKTAENEFWYSSYTFQQGKIWSLITFICRFRRLIEI